MPTSVDFSTVDGMQSGVHIVRIDYTNTSAQVLNEAGDCVAHYGPGINRHTVAAYLAPDGWHLAPDGKWTTTTPPDGRQHPVHYQEVAVADRPHTVPAETLNGLDVTEEIGRILSTEAVAVIAGLAAPAELVKAGGINPSDGVWDEIRAAFPVSKFQAWVNAADGDCSQRATPFYTPEHDQ